MPRINVGVFLKKAMQGPGIHIPHIFYMDTKLNAKDLMLIGTMLSYVDEKNGRCSPVDSQLAIRIRARKTDTVLNIRKKLEKLGYLTWQPAINDQRKNEYTFDIPITSSEWAKRIDWKISFDDEREFTSHLNEIFGEEIITPKKGVDSAILYNSNLMNKEIKDIKRRMKKSPQKRGYISSAGEPCVRDENSIYFEDDPHTTNQLISTYATWLQRSARGNGDKRFFRLNLSSPYYKYFVKLRKRLVEFRGDHQAPENQQLFWDYFRIIGKILDEWGYDRPYVNQLASDGLWIPYVNYITDNFPSGTYWLPSY